MTVTLQQLMYFVAVANVRSFTRAADQVGVAQPTLSRALRSLEDELGAPLLNRGSVVTLTPAGDGTWTYTPDPDYNEELSRPVDRGVSGDLRSGLLIAV